MIPVVEKNANPQGSSGGSHPFQIRDNLLSAYADVYTPEALHALAALAHFNFDQKQLMAARIQRRARRFRDRERIQFLDADAYIPRTLIKVQDAREGRKMACKTIDCS